MLSYEVRDDHAEVAVRNVETFFGAAPAELDPAPQATSPSTRATSRSTG